MAIPAYRDVCLPFLRFAAAQSGGGDVRLADARQHLAEEFQLTEEEIERRSGKYSHIVFRQRVRWARHDLIGAGFIRSTGHGTFMITKEGEQFLSEAGNYTDLKNKSRFKEHLLRVQEEKRQQEEQRQSSSPDSQVDGGEDLEGTDSPPDKKIQEGYNGLKQSLYSDLKDRILAKEEKNDDEKFEKMVLRVLEKIGYGEWIHSGRSGDGGIDGIMNKDPLGFRRVFVQVKHYDSSNTIGAAAIREFAGSLGKKSSAGQGVFVTSSSFTKGAEKEAETTTPHHIVLIDGDRLTELMIKHEIGIRVKEIHTTYDIDNNFWTLDDD